MQQTRTFVLALALAAALPLSLEAQGRDKAPGQKCRAEGGTSNSRACRDRYGENQDRRARDRDDRDSDRDTDRRRARRADRRASNGSVCIDANRDGYCDAGRGTSASTCRDSDRDGTCDWREGAATGSNRGTNGCADIDNDGICDSRDNCIDRNRDGRCDGSTTSGSNTGGNGPWWGDILNGGTRARSSFPSMSLATRVASGERPSGLRTYFSTTDLRVRNVDRDRDGRPESASWVDRSGKLVQVWQDQNEDGRADRVSLYENGRLVRTVQ